MTGDGWPDHFDVVPAWAVPAATACVFGLGALGGILVALIDIRHHHRART